ncbi:MAG: GNAT family N-acetyltransferase [Ruminococcaceae bacterium]|nr:GNAT family N-acetyltransferase [Oscillospiraceae bacterium]
MLQTKRLFLRNLCPEDAEIMFAYRNDVRCSRYQRYEDTGMEYLRGFVNTYGRCGFLSLEEEQHYAVAAKENDEMIGDLSVFFSEEDHCFTLGITISPAHQRQGYACELLARLVDDLQEKYPEADVVALIERENVPSIALFQKLGFAEECYAESIQSWIYVMEKRL